MTSIIHMLSILSLHFPLFRTSNYTSQFEDITVHVPEVAGCLPCCTCKDSPIRNYGVEYFGMSVEERAAFYTLDRVSGCVKSGEVSVCAGNARKDTHIHVSLDIWPNI